MRPAIEVRGLCHRYGERRALDGVEFAVESGTIFGLLGPNGGGKTTLFRILSTLLPIQTGSADVLGFDLARRPNEIRRRIGVTFQSPSIDPKLTVGENLKHQGHLYGLSGRILGQRIDLLSGKLGLKERLSDRAETLSGGLKRRVEIAKGLLHRPQALLLDEPSTGLDPGARHDLWRYLRGLKEEEGVTVLVTTHLMEEAERCDRLGILDQGRLVALDTPHALRATLGGDYVTVHCDSPDVLGERIRERFGVTPQRIGGALRIGGVVPTGKGRGHEFVRDLVEAFPDEVETVSLGKPTLEDVFIERTGHRFWDEEAE
jgi:ABC-2 type transport system ATP-binding protein